VSGRRVESVSVAARDAPRLIARLAAALAGDGPVLNPVLPGTPPPGLVGPVPDEADDPSAVVITTSGSTGTPRHVVLQASALLASASATHDRLGGPGQWLLALPLHHVAGVQVLVRSLVGRTGPALAASGTTTSGFDPVAFAEATEAMHGPRRYTALVPTQLIRLLQAGGAPLRALARLDAVLIGGAALPAALRAEAAGAGVRVVSTYGMTETCGGCVYDGRPLDGVQVGVDGDGQLLLGGPVVARGYLGAGDGHEATDPDRAFDTDAAGVRWFRTDDLGALDGGTVRVLGRADDALLTGGVTVSPRAVEDAVLTLPAVAETVVVGIPDPHWGQQVVAAVVPRAGTTAPTLEEVRAVVAARIEPAAAPRRLLVLSALPLVGPGKPDRRAVAALAAQGSAPDAAGDVGIAEAAG